MTVSIDVNFPELRTHVTEDMLVAQLSIVRARREGGRWSQCECSNGNMKAAFAMIGGISLCRSIAEVLLLGRYLAKQQGWGKAH